MDGNDFGSSDRSQIPVLSDLVTWIGGRPMWQQDALRRLWQQGELTTDDLDDLEAMCKVPHGALSQDQAPPTPQPLNASHVPAGGSASESVTLCRISDVSHVNALAPNQVLRFHPTGLTIIYGRNASGKSGYTRILKKACRARASTDPILPNAYADPPAEQAAATIEFEVAGEAKSVVWREGQSAPEALSAVSIFDAACANVHVEKTNNVAYTPAVLGVLRQLGDACRTINKRLQDEATAVRQLKAASLLFPKCRDYTKVGALIRSLNETTDVDVVSTLATLSGEEQKRLEQLRADLARNPAKAAQELAPRKTRLANVIAQVQTAENMLSDSALAQHGSLVDDARTKSDAARVAATELFRNEPLRHVGSDTWRALWDAARGYSERETYPGLTYPYTGEGARCVLCQQELSPEAVSRFTRFEDYVKANAQKAAEEAAQKVTSRQEEIESLGLGLRACHEMFIFLRDEMGETEAAAKLLAFLRRARWRKRLALRAKDGSVLTTGRPDLGESPAGILVHVQSSLQTRITELQEAARSSDRRTQEVESHELEDRVWLAGVLGDVCAEIKRLATLEALQRCIADTDTHALSLKSSDVAQTLVTKALRETFADEIRDLGMDHLKVSMVPEGSRVGVPQFKVALATKTDAKTGEILCEGERRCVALAAFLSELATADTRSGIVFDDPVCSLDHDYREAFANRLVKECSKRQVIVLTHDLWFLFQIAHAAEKAQADPHYQYVSRNGALIGLCDCELPFKARPLPNTTALERLKTRV